MSIYRREFNRVAALAGPVEITDPWQRALPPISANHYWGA